MISPDVQRMPTDKEIYQSANELIRQHGDGGAFHAAMRDAMLQAGDLDGLAVWRRIIRAIDELTSRGAPGSLH